jgi:hypothetical protein
LTPILPNDEQALVTYTGLQSAVKMQGRVL